MNRDHKVVSILCKKLIHNGIDSQRKIFGGVFVSKAPPRFFVLDLPDNCPKQRVFFGGC